MNNLQEKKEVVSSNEELQKRERRIGNLKEEIEATNEELITTNQELRRARSPP